MHVLEFVPLLTTIFYCSFYPIYFRALKGKLSSEGFWKVWFLAPLLVILAFSPNLELFLIFIPPALAALYLILKGRIALVSAIELVLAGLETFLYLKA